MTNLPPPQKDLAVKLALENKWKEAYEENKRLLEEKPEDIDTLNRIAYTLIKLGKFRKAKELYQQVKKIDKTNPIALKNIKRLDNMNKNSVGLTNSSVNLNLQDVFIEEAGKT